MPRIHQIYVTDCTARDAVFDHGYTARAGSLPARELQPCYLRTVDQALMANNYEPPRDLPREERALRGPRDLPARLAYYPSFNGYRLLGQVSYRSHDARRERVSCYFAHFLFAKNGESFPPWSAEQCLRLWGSPFWRCEDSAEIPKLLDWLEHLPEEGAAIGDEVLHSFLSAPAGGPFYDPCGVILESYAQRPPAERQALLERVLERFLSLDRRQGDSLLLTADPDFAALLFYGVCRLTPPAVLGDDVGFSTYESNLRHLPAPLVATTFFDPEVENLRPEDYPPTARLLNVFRPLPPPGDARLYPALAVRTLATGGPAALNRLRTRLAELGAGSAADLERFAEIESAVARMIEGNDVAIGPWDDSSLRCAQLAARELLVACNDNLNHLQQASVSKHVSQILRLLYGAVGAGSFENVAAPFVPLLDDNALLQELSGGPEGERQPLPDDFRLALLKRYVEAKTAFPAALVAELSTPPPLSAAGVESPETAPPLPSLATLLPGLAVKLSLKTIVALYESQIPTTPPGPVALPWLRAVCQAQTDLCDAAVWRILQLGQPLPDEHFRDLQVRAGASRAARTFLVDQLPTDEDALRRIANLPNIPLIVELALTPDSKGAHAAQDAVSLRRILRFASPPALARLVARSGIDARFRLSLLKGFVRQHNQVPEDLKQILYSAAGDATQANGQMVWLLRNLLLKLPSESIHQLYGRAPPDLRPAFFHCLVQLCQEQHDGESRVSADLSQAVGNIVAPWTSEEYKQQLLERPPALVHATPLYRVLEETAEIVKALDDPLRAGEFWRHVELLERLKPAWENLGFVADGPPWIAERAGAWLACAAALRELYKRYPDTLAHQTTPLLADEFADYLHAFRRACPPEISDVRRQQLVAAITRFAAPPGRHVSALNMQTLCQAVAEDAIRKRIASIHRVLCTPGEKLEPTHYVEGPGEPGTPVLRCAYPDYFPKRAGDILRVYAEGQLVESRNSRQLKSLKSNSKQLAWIELRKEGVWNNDMMKLQEVELKLVFSSNAWFKRNIESPPLRISLAPLREFRDRYVELTIYDGENRPQNDPYFLGGLLNATPLDP